MRNILAVIGAAVVVFAAAGWYFKWYSFAVSPGTDGKQHIEVDVDTHKIADDVKKAGDAVGSAVQNTQTKGDAKAPPADFVGPPPPPDMPAKVGAPPTPGQLALPRPGPAGH